MRWSVWWPLSALILIGTVKLASDKDASCQSLAEEGFWQHKTDHHVWQPSTCTLGHYEKKHIDQCFENSSLNFFGDSTVRQVFFVVARRILPGYQRTPDKHKPQHVQSLASNLSIHFYWDAYLALPLLEEQAAAWRNGTSEEGVLVIGGGLHFAGYSKEPLKDFSSRYNSLLFPPSTSSKGLHVYVNPLLPTEQTLIKSNEVKSKVLTLEREAPLNDFLRQNIPDTPSLTTLWSYNEQVLGRPDTNELDGIHVRDEVNDLKADIFLNHYCNSRLAAKKALPAGATCCVRNGNFHLSQLAALLILTAWIAFTLWSPKRNLARKETTAILLIMATCILAFICDRTDAFGRLEKLHDQKDFLIFVVAIVLLPMCLSMTSAPIKSPDLSVSTRKGQDILNRLQTDEWKGWMQALILLYHWTGTSKVAWIYRTVRLLVAAYLFATGYGNTLYYLKTGDYSIRRLLRQLLRLNLLSVMLSYTMNAPYLGYYFAPLVSLWAIIIYATTASLKHYNTSFPRFFFKLIISALVVFIIIKTEGILEAIFHIVNTVFSLNWQVKQSRFRIALDLYVVYFGMITAYFLNWYASSDDSTQYGQQISKLAKALSSTFMQLLLSAFCLSSMLTSALFAFSLPSNDSYNAWHPYISPFVIIAFIILRNVSLLLRSKHSSIMARLGRCSLETFTLQFHLFLANDTHATLTLGLEHYFGQQWWLRYLQFIFFSALLVVISEEVARATGILVQGLISDEPKDSRQSDESASRTYEDLSEKEEVHEGTSLLPGDATSLAVKHSACIRLYLEILAFCATLIFLNHLSSR